MSSTEQAPEPTMEEILASIRRVISDDESNSARQRATYPSDEDEERLEARNEEADTRIIDDIARVLSGGAPADDGDDILELTKELGRPEFSEVDAETTAAPTESGFIPSGFIPAAPVNFQTDSYTAVAIARSDDAGFMPVADDGASTEPDTASAEAASALEEAIAALRAGEVPTELDFETLAAQPVADNVAPAAEEAPSWSDAAWGIREETMPEPAQTLPRFNGGTARRAHDYSEDAELSAKSLEDSVKDMLRPLLRQWLDENMSRVLAAALRDELTETEAKRRQG
jgi:uncharacterized protein